MRLAGRPTNPKGAVFAGAALRGNGLASVTMQAGSAMLHPAFGHGRGVYVHAFVTDIMQSFVRWLHGWRGGEKYKGAWQACRQPHPMPTQGGNRSYTL